MDSQTTRTDSAKGSQNQQADVPSDRQWAHLHLLAANRKNPLTGTRLQQFIDRLALERLDKPVEPEPEIQVPKVISDAIYHAEKHYPDDVGTIVDLLGPYSRFTIKDIDFRPAKGSSSYFRHEVSKALPWLKIDQVALHIIGQNWTPRDPIRDVNDKAGDTCRLLDDMFPRTLEARKDFDPEKTGNAGSTTMAFQGYLLETFKQSGAYRYGLVSNEDIHRLMLSIIIALNAAVVMSVVEPDQRLAQQALSYVDWQLSGNPIMSYRDGVAHVLVAPQVYA